MDGSNGDGKPSSSVDDELVRMMEGMTGEGRPDESGESASSSCQGISCLADDDDEKTFSPLPPKDNRRICESDASADAVGPNEP